MDNNGKLYMFGEPPARPDYSKTEANWISELSSVWIEDLALGDHNIAVIASFLQNPLTAVFREHGRSSDIIRDSKTVHKDIIQKMVNEKIRGLEKIFFSQEKKQGRRGSRKWSFFAGDVSNHRRKSSLKAGEDGNSIQEKFKSLFANKLSLPVNKIHLTDKNSSVKTTQINETKHSRDFKSIRLEEPKQANSSAVSETHKISSRQGNSHCPPVSRILKEQQFDHHKYKSFIDIGFSKENIEKLLVHKVKLPELGKSFNDKKFSFVSAKEKEDSLQSTFHNFGIKEGSLNIYSSRGPQDFDHLSQANQDLPFQEYGDEYYLNVSKLILGSPDNEYFRMPDRKDVSDFFKHNVAKPRELFMELVEDGKLKKLMKGMLLSSLDQTKSVDRALYSDAKRYKIVNDDDAAREHCKEEIGKAKMALGKFEGKCNEASKDISETLKHIKLSKGYLDGVINSVVAVNGESIFAWRKDEV